MTQTPWQRKMAKAREERPVETVIRVPLDPEPIREFERVKAQATSAEQTVRARYYAANAEKMPLSQDEVEEGERFVSGDPVVIAARAALDVAQEAVHEATLYMMFRSLRPGDYEAAQAPYLKDDGSLDLNAFGPVLVALCHVHVEPGPEQDGEPTWIESEGMTEEEAREFLASPSFNAADKAAVTGAAYQVNATTRVGYADLGKGSRPIPA